jgi:hypothetical protein
MDDGSVLTYEMIKEVALKLQEAADKYPPTLLFIGNNEYGIEPGWYKYCLANKIYEPYSLPEQEE